MSRRLAAIAVALAVALALAALWLALGPKPPPPPERLVLERVDFAALPGWDRGQQGGALTAFKRSCARLDDLPADRGLGGGGIAGRGADWRRPCRAAAEVAGADGAARAFFETWFQPFAARAGDTAEGLFTGYFEPLLRGSRERSGPNRVPLYAPPPDLVMVDLGLFRDDLEGRRIAGRVVAGRLRPFETRSEIEAGGLTGKAPVLAWVDDPVAAFFLHVQGSGRVALEDGRILRVGYAGHNGHPYVAIGAELVRMGALALEEVSLQTISAWLRRHPAEAAAVMARNPSYVFFRELGTDGPVGAQGVVLTPGRSLAVDRRYIPLSVPLWLDAEVPAAAGLPDRRLRRLMVAQDSGGAIRGPVRGDVFWGHGRDAEAIAGRMRHQGRYYLLLPRALADRARPEG